MRKPSVKKIRFFPFENQKLTLISTLHIFFNINVFREGSFLNEILVWCDHVDFVEHLENDERMQRFSVRKIYLEDNELKHISLKVVKMNASDIRSKVFLAFFSFTSITYISC